MRKPKPFLRMLTDTGPLAVLAVAIALLVGIVVPASAQFFNFGGPQRACAARWWRRRRLVRRRLLCPLPAAGAQARDAGFLQGAAARQARSEFHSRAQRDGARRRHGRLARLRSRRRLCRAARHGRDPQAPRDLRPDQVSAEGRAVRLGGGGQGHSGDRKARRHCRDARHQRPRADARSCGGKIRQGRRQEAREKGRQERRAQARRGRQAGGEAGRCGEA